jgi:hypothetical protein
LCRKFILRTREKKDVICGLEVSLKKRSRDYNTSVFSPGPILVYHWPPQNVVIYVHPFAQTLHFKAWTLCLSVCQQKFKETKKQRTTFSNFSKEKQKIQGPVRPLDTCLLTIAAIISGGFWAILSCSIKKTSKPNEIILSFFRLHIMQQVGILQILDARMFSNKMEKWYIYEQLGQCSFLGSESLQPGSLFQQVYRVLNIL